LTLMLGPTEAALGSPDRALRADDLEMVHRNQLRLLKLVNALLDFSRIEAGRAQATYQPTDISALTRELAGAFRSAIEHAGLRFDVRCDPISALVYVDRDMWEKVVLNLLSNAFKFTLEGSIGLALTERDGRVELIVRDTGTGIPEAEVKRVFERFHRVEGARSRTHEGSGIGLALTCELVHLHGGDIAVASRLGEGSVFTVQIPTGSAHLPQDRLGGTPSLASSAMGARGAAPFVEEATRWLPQQHEVAISAGRSGTTDVGEDEIAGRRGARERILVVDDNADMRDYLSRLLRHWDVDTAGNGAVALERVRVSPPDLVLADVMMPELDGFELLRALRGNASTSHIPVMLLSARAGEEATLEGIASGANDYVVKPFTARDLLGRVEAQLSRAKEREALRERTAQIQSVIKMLRSGKLPADTQKRALEALERNAKAQTQLVDDLLDVSRIISGKLAIKTDVVDMSAVIAGAIDAIPPSATAKRVCLNVALPPDVRILVTGDADRLRQVAWNLLSNAVKFTPGGGSVDVEVRRTESRAELVAGDSGQGIDPSFLPHVFERFRQADSSAARADGGLGLGLAIVRHLTEAHGGTVSADSAGLGRGATFVVGLPIRAVAPLAAVAVEPLAGSRARTLVGARALIVDDEADARELIRFVLEAEGAEVTLTESAGAALHLFGSRQFDVLVADISMPEQDGYSLIRAIRSLSPSTGGTVPAIAVTADASLREREEALDAGYDWHLSKPVEPEQLVAAVSSVLQSRSSGLKQEPGRRKNPRGRSKPTSGSRRSRPRRSS
jgi:signal transduction histidine kinase